MRKLALAVLIALCCAGAWGSHAEAEPRLDSLASTFAMRPVTVTCSDMEDGLYGLTYMAGDDTLIAQNLCDALLGGGDDFHVALAVLVIVHESYHLRYWDRRFDERTVECQAIRHWRVGMRLFGYDEAYTARLKPWALAAHYWIQIVNHVYWNPGCKTPWPLG